MRKFLAAFVVILLSLLFASKADAFTIGVSGHEDYQLWENRIVVTAYHPSGVSYGSGFYIITESGKGTWAYPLSITAVAGSYGVYRVKLQHPYPLNDNPKSISGPGSSASAYCST